MQTLTSFHFRRQRTFDFQRNRRRKEKRRTRGWTTTAAPVTMPFTYGRPPPPPPPPSPPLPAVSGWVNSAPGRDQDPRLGCVTRDSASSEHLSLEQCEITSTTQQSVVTAVDALGNMLKLSCYNGDEKRRDERESFEASVVMQRLSYPTETVLSNKITLNKYS